jgi:transcriptional regulator with XRE-family HTH domain
MLTFADRFKHALERKGVTQLEVRDSLGLKGGAVSHWATGRHVPDYENAKRVAELLEVNPCWLVFGEGEIKWKTRKKK